MIYIRKKLISWTPSKLRTSVLQNPVKEVEKQATYWKKIFTIHLSDKLVSTMYKELSTLNNKKLYIPLKNGKNI